MHETRRTGVRFVLTNPSDPGRLDDFTDWYDTYAEALTVPATSPTPSISRTPTPPPGRTARATRRSTTSSPPTPRRPGPTPSTRPTTRPTCSATRAPGWSRRHSAPPTPSSDPRPGRASTAGPGIHVILSNGGDDTGRQHREAQVLQTGLFYSAARFRIIEGSPEPAEWLEVFETDARDPLDTFAQAPSDTPSTPAIEAVLSESFRLVSTSNTGTA
jgi:hypothetical protein